ncbi:MAG: ABC transporter substrate-binding protein [Lachnospiraceae bacterium]|nr:ABC transporter substrate-binding protein [Lachnospiraceae bacterium]
MKKLFVSVIFLIFLTGLAGCGEKVQEDFVTLRVLGKTTTNLAIEEAAYRFEKLHTNVKIEYEYMQNYDALLEKRLSCDAPEVDLFLNTGIVEGNPLAKYCVNLLDIESEKNLAFDYSDSLDCIVKPYINEHMHSIPLMAMVYGVYVNKTLLNHYGINVPSNYAKFMSALEFVKEKGYVPIHGNPMEIAASFAFSGVCLELEKKGKADIDDLYGNAENIDTAEIFAIFNDYVDKGYIVLNDPIVDVNDGNYELGYNDNDEMARSFFNIKYDETERKYKKCDDLGRVPFLIASTEFAETLNNCKQNYSSEIEYEFILLPISEASGYAYILPTHAISICKTSENIDYAVEFLNFMFSKEENVNIANVSGEFPNVYDINKYINQRLGVPEKFIFEYGKLEFKKDEYGFLNFVFKEADKIYGMER